MKTPRRILSTRNLLCALALLCEVVTGVTLMVGTRSPDQVPPIAPLLREAHQYSAEAPLLDRLRAALESQHRLLVTLNDGARAQARLIGAVGFLLLLLAWRESRDAKREQASVAERPDPG
jgi:hypothetical protein